MDAPSCPASLIEVAILRRVENYYIPAHCIIFTPDPEPKRLLKIYIGLRSEPHIAKSLKKKSV